MTLRLNETEVEALKAALLFARVAKYRPPTFDQWDVTFLDLAGALENVPCSPPCDEAAC